jgi:hypothetical protein
MLGGEHILHDDLGLITKEVWNVALLEPLNPSKRWHYAS